MCIDSKVAVRYISDEYLALTIRYATIILIRRKTCKFLDHANVECQSIVIRCIRCIRYFISPSSGKHIRIYMYFEYRYIYILIII